MSIRRLIFVFVSVWLFWAPRCFRIFFNNAVTHELVFCDVGQGDAILIRDGDTEILVDGGPDASVMQCLRDHLPVYDRTIELMVLTHPDADHFTGLTSVLAEYNVKTVWANNIAKASLDYYAFYSELMTDIIAGDLTIYSPQLGDFQCLTNTVCVEVVSDFREILTSNVFESLLSFGQLSQILSDSLPNSYDYNDGSIVLNLYFDDISVLLTGDAEEGQELALIRAGLLTDVDVLKAGHHGSKSSTSLPFLQIVQPETSIISCGQNNRYGHPHAQTLDYLVAAGSTVYRTDTMGEVAYICRGRENCSWQTARDPP